MGFKDFIGKVKDKTVAGFNEIKAKINDWKDDKECKKKLEESFKADENAVMFKVHFLTGKISEFVGLLDFDNKIIKMDSDLKKPEIEKIVDNKGNEYFVEYINTKKVKYQANIQRSEEEYVVMEKDLDEIHYTNIKPKEDKPPVYNTYNITQDDHSTNYKGIKNSNIGSKDSSVDIKKETNVDVSANLHHKKGE